MNEDHIAPMTPLDQMLAQDSLQMLKAAVPYFPADAQRVFALYAKMMELSHTIAMFSGGPAELMMMSEESGTSQPLDILQQLRTYAGLICLSRTGDFADASGTCRSAWIRR